MSISSMRERYCQLCSHSESLQDVPVLTCEWCRRNSGFPRNSLSCVLPNFQCNSVQDEWLLTLPMTWTITTTVHWSLLVQFQILMNSQWFPNSFANFGKPFPCIDDMRFAWNETPSLTYSCVSPHLASVSRRWLSPKNHLSFSCFQVSAFGVCSCCLAWECTAGFWLVSRSCLDAGWNTALFRFGILRVVGIAQILRRILPRTQEVVRHQIRRSRLRHRRTFSGSTFLSSLWHGTLLSVWKKEMDAREQKEIHDIQQTKKTVPLITCEAFFG